MQSAPTASFGSADGFHFGLFEISTLITLSISLVVLISSLRKPLEILFLALFPLAVLSIIASLAIRSEYPPTNMSPSLASHVLISILAYSFITIAALQASFLAYQNHQLKHGHAGGIIRKLPSLQDMEAFLFELVWVGQIFCSLSLSPLRSYSSIIFGGSTESYTRPSFPYYPGSYSPYCFGGGINSVGEVRPQSAEPWLVSPCSSLGSTA